MQKIKFVVHDIFKSMTIGAGISLLIMSISWAICLFLYKGNIDNTLFFVKNALYYVGIFTLFLSAAFFIQRNATRPLDYEDEWKRYFNIFNLGFVILFIAITISIFGMIVQIIIENRGGVI